jgi:hypothetical protein
MSVHNPDAASRLQQEGRYSRLCADSGTLELLNLRVPLHVRELVRCGHRLIRSDSDDVLAGGAVSARVGL